MTTLPREGRIIDGVHHYPVRVYYEDTDAGGVVYFANYLKFAERARTEMLRSFGFEHSRLQREYGVILVVRRSTVDFLSPARLDDDLVVLTRLASHGGATVGVVQDLRRGDVTLARVETRIACVNAQGRPTRLPAALTAAIAVLPREHPAMVTPDAR